MSDIFHKQFIKWGVIPLLLLVLWLGLSLQFIDRDPGISLIATDFDKSHIANFRDSELLRGEKVNGEFTATDNFLGIVSVRFFNFNRISDDSIIFRIKEKNRSQWFYEQSYRVDQFQPNAFFTFGFPIIPDSKKRTYQFQLESVNGKRNNAIALSPLEPVFETKYQYPISAMKNNSSFLMTYLQRKLFTTITNSNFLVSSIIYLLPFVFYLLWTFLFKKYLSKRYSIVLFPGIFALLYSTVSVEVSYVTLFILIILWIVMLVSYRLEGKVSFLLAGLFIFLSPILYIIGLEQIARNTAMWGYIFLSIGVLHQIWEATHPKMRLVTYNSFLAKLSSGMKIQFIKK